MPYENEHACRLRDPGDFKDGSFRRTERKHEGKTYSVIMGKLKGQDAMTEQAYRYKKDTWTAAQARDHCKDHDGSFEPAKDSKANEFGDIERRIIAFEQTELRVDDDRPMLVGYAAKTGIFTDLGWFREKIAPGAFADVLGDDVRCLKNHDPNLILGRTTNQTLRIRENSVGLRYENDLPDTNTGRDVREEVRRRDISGCSFAFTIAEDAWVRYDDDRPPERTIVKLRRLYDVGPVTYPAYPDTTVAARSLEIHRNTHSDEGKYECECIECGHTLKTDEHCKDIKCPKCGGQMRRKERPGPGQKSDDVSDASNTSVTPDEATASQLKEVSPERRRDIDKKYRKMGRILARNKPAEV